MKIPERYKDAKLEDVPERVKSAFNETIKNQKGLYIYGGVGTGKTHIAYAIQKRWYELGQLSLFWNMTELIDEIRSDFNRTEKEFIGESVLNYQKLLFLDDIGAEKPTEWVEEKIYLIVNKRYNDMLPTIFTSNLGINELSDRVGDRIASRIVEMCEIINLEGEDRRLLNQVNQ
jgi:DNA replication protein DnaC